MKTTINIFSNVLQLLTIFAFLYFLVWALRSFIGAYTYHRAVSYSLLAFSIAGFVFQVIALFVVEKNDSLKKKILRFVRVLSAIVLVYFSFLYKASPGYVMSYWDLEPLNKASIVYCYDNTSVWFGEGDRYAILEIPPETFSNYIPALRSFDEEKDWSFGGYYLKYSPERFKNFMVSEKLGPEYMFETKKGDTAGEQDNVHKVRIHIWMPSM